MTGDGSFFLVLAFLFAVAAAGAWVADHLPDSWEHRDARERNHGWRR